MMQDDFEQKELYMPAGLHMKKEIFQGYTKEELIPTIIATLMFIVIDCVLFMSGIHTPSILFFVPVIGTTTVVFMLIKGELNLSPLNIIQLDIDFIRSQKYYPYIAMNEWDNED